MRCTEVRVRRACSQSRLPGLDWALNPYRGCQHGCVYCYSPDVLRLGSRKDWGSWVEARSNIPKLLARERKKLDGVVGLGTVTDPYQPAEERYKLTRYCLEQMAIGRLRASIQTKSDLVTRDIDLLERMDRPEVIITVTTTDTGISGNLEPGAPPPEKRLAAMRELSEAGITTMLFLGPVIPGINDSSESLARVVDAAASAGADRVMYDVIRLKPLVRESLRERFGYTASRSMFRTADDPGWRERVGIDIEVLCDDAGIAEVSAF